MSSEQMKRGDRIRFKGIGLAASQTFEGEILDFAPRVFGGSGCCIETDAGWTFTEQVVEHIPRRTNDTE